MSWVDYISQVGGLLGLFLGFRFVDFQGMEELINQRETHVFMYNACLEKGWNKLFLDRGIDSVHI